jgi:hypothetical protein
MGEFAHRSKRSSVAIALALVLVFGASALSSAFLSRPATRAHELLVQGMTLQIGRSGLREVEAVAGRFGTTPGNDCSPNDCQVVVTVDNSRLPSRWRGSGATFGASFLIEKGTLVEREYALASGVGPNRPFAEVREREHWHERTEPRRYPDNFERDRSEMESDCKSDHSNRSRGAEPVFVFQSQVFIELWRVQRRRGNAAQR